MRYVFANCEVDNQLRTVRRGATQRTLRPKPLQLLCYLLDHSDRVVSHQELAEQLWPNQSVRDALIRDNVQTVRRAVGDTSRAQRIIQTLPGQGYRVVVPVTLIVEESADEERKDLSTSTMPPARESGSPTEVEEAPLNASVNVSPTVSEPARRTPEAERRQLTVMFCDLVGSTELSVQLDPEDLREVIQAYQETTAQMIERFEGHIAQYLGDGLLIYFGFPVAHEDDAQRAVYAGLGIVKAIETLNQRLASDQNLQLGVRIAIHTGPVVLGEMGSGGRSEQLALGSTPNFAARLHGLAQPNTVVISDVTYRLIQGYFVCRDLGLQTLQGVTAPIQVFHVQQESGAQSRLDIARATGLTPLVGRGAEVMLLLERWALAKTGMGQVVLLSGEAGIGKSRLVQVLKDHVADEPHIRLECSSSSYFTNSAFYPIVDLFQRTLNFQEDDSPNQRLEKLEQAVEQYRLPVEEAAPLMAGLLSLSWPEDRYPPLNLTPQRQRQKTLETIGSMVLELAEREPVVFIVEDLHWTDPSTLELLDFLVDQTPTASIYVLLTSRPEFQAQWANQSYVSQMTLNRLPRDEIEQMAIQVAGGKSLPREVLQELVEKTDGVPLYLEEMTKAVLESGLLKEGDERYEHTDFISTLSIPTTLQSSLMARLDRLATAKAVAQYAAVIGRQFSYELLQAVSQLDDAMLQHELGRLLEAELIYQRGLPPQATYTFKHALIQDTAYESLLRRTRQHYHSQIAHALETRFSESANHQPELLAHHYTEAGLAEQAVAYWQQAGQRAIQGSANVEAIAHLTKGLALLRTQPETPVRLQQELALEVALGSALLTTKGYGAPEVERIYARAQALCQQLGDTPQLFPVLRGLILYYVNRGDIHTASQLGEQLMHLAESQCDPALLLLAHYMLGVVLSKRGQSTLAYAHHMQALTIYNPQAHRHLALRYGTDLGVAAHSFMAMELWQLGSPDAALGHIEAARTLAQEVSHPFSLVQALFYGAVLHQHRREAVAAQEQAAAMITLATEQGFAQRLAWGQALHGWALALQGKCEVGMTEMRQGIAADLATGARLYQPYFLSLLAEGYRESGRPEAGLQTLSEGLAVIDNTEMFWHQAELHRLKGELLLRQAVPDTSQAESCFQLAVDIARNQEAKSWELRAAVSLACLWQFQDKCQDAYNLLAPVYNWFNEGFDTADLQDAKALLDELET